MALPMPPPPILMGPINPVEQFLSSFNTNTYFIGLMMIILNLGGRHLAPGLTPEQDKIFQNVWARRILLFVVIFVATRNIFTAFWMSIGSIIIIGYLTNEMSSLYLFGTPVPPPPPPQQPQGLTSEENEIFKRLQDKLTKLQQEEKQKQVIKSPNIDAAALSGVDGFLGSYMDTMKLIQSTNG